MKSAWEVQNSSGRANGQLRRIPALSKSRPAMKTKKLLRNFGSIGIAAAIALCGVVREALALLTGGEEKINEFGPHESDVTGEYNYRTGRLDDGTDPYGWYERD